MARKFTFVLNFDKASEDSYQTWFTVRFNGDANGTMECLGNDEGNGQVWNAIGTWNGPLKVLAFRDTDCFASRVIATIMERKGWAHNAKSFGVQYPKACAIDVTETRLTAAPSLRAASRGETVRDKNVSQKWNAITAMTGRMPCYSAPPEAIDDMQAVIERNRAQDKKDKAEAKRLGMKIAEYRSLKKAGLV